MKEVKPKRDICARVKLPGSKSYTQRAMAIAALAEGESILEGALIAEDTGYLGCALTKLGAGITCAGDTMTISGNGGRISNPREELFLGNNGTALRFLTSLVCLGRGRYTLTGSPRLKERPVGPLQEALRNLGVSVESLEKPGFPPVIVEAAGLPGGRVTFGPVESSQYLSSLLIAAPYARAEVEIGFSEGQVSRPYLDLTGEVMEAFGVPVERKNGLYRVPAGQGYKGRHYKIEPDLSGASYFFLAAALTCGQVTVEGVNPRSLQGDRRFLRLLGDWGCQVQESDRQVTVRGNVLAGGDYLIDMGDIPDLVPTVAVLAAFRRGRTIIANAAHLRHKESNRLAALAGELSRMGIRARETGDGLEITGGTPEGAAIETYGDHRLAMAFAVAGLVVPGIRIKGGECVNKSFPDFWEELERL